MAATAHDSTELFAAGPARPSLEVVRNEAAEAEAPSPGVSVVEIAAEEPLVGRVATIGAALGFAIVTIGIAVAGIVGGMEVGSALGLGAFVGAFGGAGFGYMMTASLTLARRIDAENRDRSTNRARRE